MPDEQTPSIVYHLDWAGRIPKGQVIHVDDRPGGQADVYFHPLHVREPLLWELNSLSHNHVGFGYWRQRWTHEGRVQEEAEHLGVAVSAWKIVSPDEMPDDRHIFFIENKGTCLWLVRSGYCTVTVQNQMNAMLLRAAGDGLWEQSWDDGQDLPKPRPCVPLVAPPLVPTSV
ncbi:hypothetical protein ACFUIY_37600 [Streptomyces griseorubiginosus]|uniref:hypothetical protein n=1 Tax=Streptomyces griseorubiginosus TaxID=67304 RepID=UPI00362956C2